MNQTTKSEPQFGQNIQDDQLHPAQACFGQPVKKWLVLFVSLAVVPHLVRPLHDCRETQLGEMEVL